MDEQKASKDIIAEMRAKAECAKPYDDGVAMMLTGYADRLEAALKREKAAIEADALAVGGIVGAAHERELPKNASKNGADSGQLGNVAKLREALGKLRAELWNNTVIAGKRKFELYEIADAALAAPARNCDAGAAEDQTRRYEDYCRAHTGVTGCTGCPLAGCRRCQIAWAQLAYTEGGTK